MSKKGKLIVLVTIAIEKHAIAGLVVTWAATNPDAAWLPQLEIITDLLAYTVTQKRQSRFH